MNRRICNMAILALLALALSCGSPPYVRVHVSALTGAPDIGQLQVAIEKSDQTVSTVAIPPAESPTALPLPQTFSLELPASTAGSVRITVAGKMRDANSAQISGTTTVDIKGGGIYEAFVALESGDATAARISVAPTEYDFAAVAVGKEAVVPFSIRNSGGQASGIPFVSLNSTGDFQRTSNCTAPLEPGQSCSVEVSFAPKSEGTQLDTLHVSAMPGNAVDVAVYGTGYIDTNMSCGGDGQPCCEKPLVQCVKSWICQDGTCVPVK